MPKIQERGQLLALTGLRFLAAFSIVVHHSRGTMIDAKTIEGLPLGGAVSFFFVLSGFILAYAHPTILTFQNIMRFYVGRIARIWPIHLLTLAIVIALIFSGIVPGYWHSLGSGIANVFLVQAWVPQSAFYFSFNAVSWSISVEMFFYLCFPALLLLKGAARILIPCALVAISIAACHLLNLPDYSGDTAITTRHGVLYIGPAARLLEFTLGMCCVPVWQFLKRSTGDNVLLWTCAELGGISLLLLYVFSWCHQASNLGFAVAGLPGAEYVGVAGAAPFFALLIVIMAASRGLVAKLLATRPFVFLGEISFTIYMVHQIPITVCGYHTDTLGMPNFWVFVALLIAVCSSIHLLLENPARRLVITTFNRWQTGGFTRSRHADRIATETGMLE